MRKQRSIDIQTLRAALDYDPLTGIFVWVRPADRCRHLIGQTAGTTSPKSGYRTITLMMKRHSEHRLAWAYVHGEIPEGMVIDHINRNRQDNRISNLRLVNWSENQQNRESGKTNKTGYVGVNKDGNRYYASISSGKKKRIVGAFDTAKDAHECYLHHRRLMHPLAFTGQANG
jgi:hypothetical protein